jgi:hypothetical protein
MHVERVLKIYTGLTCAYGLIHAARREKGSSCVTGLSLVMAAPFLWPAYVITDVVGLRKQQPRGVPNFDEGFIRRISDDSY